MISRKEEILRLRSEGLSYKQIREITGVSLSVISYHCAPGQKEKSMERQRDRRNKNVRFVQQYKNDNPCTDCGENYPYYIMEFDHIGNDKYKNVSAMVRHHTVEDIKAEIAKCELVCANCHKFRTRNRIFKDGGDSLEIILD